VVVVVGPGRVVDPEGRVVEVVDTGAIVVEVVEESTGSPELHAAITSIRTGPSRAVKRVIPPAYE
jgi:hypothetical protein